MRILHLTAEDFKRSQWSGGTTTELLIWPKGADYAKREFTVRISSATVDLEDSDFTPLPGVTRFITPLTGGFTLTHPGQMPVVMAPLDTPYRFSGETPTHCVGKATDFNLMLKGVEGKMELCTELWRLGKGLNCLYAPQAVTVQLQQPLTLQPGELLVVFTQSTRSIAIAGNAIACYANIG